MSEGNKKNNKQDRRAGALTDVTGVRPQPGRGDLTTEEESRWDDVTAISAPLAAGNKQQRHFAAGGQRHSHGWCLIINNCVFFMSVVIDERNGLKDSSTDQIDKMFFLPV